LRSLIAAVPVIESARTDNAIDIELDEKARVQARKEPSLVEVIAYKP
jgi:hypothetical protein